VLEQLLQYKKEHGFQATLDYLDELRGQVIKQHQIDRQMRLVTKVCVLCRTAHQAPQSAMGFICPSCENRSHGRSHNGTRSQKPTSWH
jgi:predicted RNA-binding Zn-ribbon protein involved in translation (DUF1610 family)